ncbi:uncharacterized protein FRV6_14876 [Fusarium oxysporum]|uniref:Uncharacterized protein n=1 Tax=Fusarium oxysporum TaxID=5507 RepID=A0A2H3TQ30_FUSOX|nr:uncharacterized protein FRV6_14876 [Fusarium oxysporum]
MDHTQPSLSAWPLCSETQPGSRSQGMQYTDSFATLTL